MTAVAHTVAHTVARTVANAVANEGGVMEKVWKLPPFFMLRIGGVPYDQVIPLRCPELTAWSVEVLAAEAALDASKDAIADSLQAVVSHVDDGLRRHLLAIRRDVFNRRLPKARGHLHAVTAVLDDADAAALTDWIDRRDAYERMLRSGAALLADELDRNRKHLRELAGNDVLRDGIVLASPSLDGFVDGYRNAGQGALSKRLRNVERTLLQYVFRTACKTSPFSTLTTVALGRYGDAAGELLAVPENLGPARSFTRLNLASLGWLRDAILDDPTLRADLPVQVVGGWQAQEDRIRYIRRTRRTGDEESVVNLDTVEEKLFFLSEGQILREILTLAGSSIRFGDLAEALHAAEPTHRSRADVNLFLGLLLRLGFLVVPAFLLDVHHTDPVGAFTEALRGLRRPWADRLAGRLGTVLATVERYPRSDRDERRALVAAARAELKAAATELGLSEVGVPRTVVYEDVTVGGTAVVGDGTAWERTLLGPLRSIASVLPVFDRTLPDRIVTKGFVVARYGRGGRCDDLMEFVQNFSQDCYEQFQLANMRRQAFGPDGGYTPHENWFRLPELTALDETRLELLRQMRLASRDGAETGEEVVLDADVLDRVATGLSGNLGVIDPRSFFLQVGRRAGGDPFAVVNRSYSGLTLLFSRFAHCFPDADGYGMTAGITEFLRDVPPPDTVLAELVGGHDTTNLNLHPAVTPYELVCPGDTSCRPESAQIRVDELSIVHDEERDQARLWCDRIGRYVVPVYLGFLLPMALSEVQRILLTFSYTPLAGLDFWDGVPGEPGPDGVVYRPRLRCGAVVVHRRTWTVPAAGIPRRAGAAFDEAWFLAWQRFRQRHGMPARVFVAKAMGGGESTDGADDGDPTPQTADKAEKSSKAPGLGDFKPQYVDFDSFLSLMALDGMVSADAGRLVVTEMSPDADELWVRSADGRHVSELVVEIDGVIDGPARRTEETGA